MVESLCVSSFSHKGTNPILRAPPSWPDWTLITSPGPTSCQHLIEDQGFRIGIWWWWGDTNTGCADSTIALCIEKTPTLPRWAAYCHTGRWGHGLSDLQWRRQAVPLWMSLGMPPRQMLWESLWVPSGNWNSRLASLLTKVLHGFMKHGATGQPPPICNKLGESIALQTSGQSHPRSDPHQ
jgi:hypothetical protein